MPVTAAVYHGTTTTRDVNPCWIRGDVMIDNDDAGGGNDNLCRPQVCSSASGSHCTWLINYSRTNQAE